MSTTLAQSPPRPSSGSDLTPATAPATCLNCGASLAGPFCAECGQRDLPPEPPLRELIAEAWDTFVSVDGKVATTVRLLLTRPGALTEEYLRGRRARFLPPLRLYLLCSVAFFLIQAALPAHKSSVKATPVQSAATIRADSITREYKKNRLDSAGLARVVDSVNALPKSWLWKRFKANGLRVANEGKNFTTDFKTQTPRVLFVLMPLFALMLGVAYRSRRRPYASHLVLSLHLHAFMFAALAAALVARTVTPDFAAKPLGWFVFAWLVSYVPLALRRVYGGRLWPAVGRTAVLTAVYSVAALVVMGVLALLLVFFY